MMMGVPLDGPAWLFGDNQSVITSSTIPHLVLNKRHNALAYHRVREAIAAGIMYFKHISGKENAADILTKFLGWNEYWYLVQPLLFWKGDTLCDKNISLDQEIKYMKDESHSGLRGVTSSNLPEEDNLPSTGVPTLGVNPSHEEEII